MKKLFSVIAITALALVLAASCGKKEDPKPKDVKFTITSIENLPATATKMRAHWSTNTTVYFSGYIQQANISDGGFSMTLPATVENAPNSAYYSIPALLDMPVNNSLNVSDSKAKGFILCFVSINNSGTPLGLLKDRYINDVHTRSYVEYIYVDRNVNVSGTSIDVDDWTATFNLKLKKGWNKVYFQYNGATETVTYSSTIPSWMGNNWAFYSFVS